MSLRFVIGPAGSGKTTTVFKEIIEASLRNAERGLVSFGEKKNYLVIVPEQFTLQTQSDICRLHPSHGTMDVDILSFERLAWLVFEELGVPNPKTIDDLGKTLLLRLVADRDSDQLESMKRNIRKNGYIQQLKSLISEFTQYSIDVDTLKKLEEEFKTKPTLAHKLHDLAVISESFRRSMDENSLPKEDLLHYFSQYISKSVILKNSVIVFDGFTGFTPNQCEVLSELFKTASDITITLTLGSDLKISDIKHDSDLFYRTRKTYESVRNIADRTGVTVEDPIYLSSAHSDARHSANEALAALERSFGKPVLSKHKLNNKSVEQDTGSIEIPPVAIYEALTPQKEADFVAAQISTLVRVNNLRYRDIAVVCSDLMTYHSHLERAFETYDVYAFMDRSKKLDSNVFANFIMSLTLPLEHNFSYESMFRILKSGFMPVDRETVDEMENFVLKRGIKGRRKWTSVWAEVKGTEMSEEVQSPDSLNSRKDKAIEPILHLVNSIKGKNFVVGKVVEAIKDFLDEIKVEDRLNEIASRLEEQGDLVRANEFKRVKTLTKELLDKVADVLNDQGLTIREFNDVLASGFAEAKIGSLPVGVDAVMVGDLDRSRNADVKVMYFIGFNDGLIPAAADNGGILSDIERETIRNSCLGIELSPSASEDAFLQKLRLYQTMLKASDHLIITYCRMGNDGKPVLPSSYLPEIMSVYDGLFVRKVENETSSFTGTETVNAALKKIAAGMYTAGTDPSWNRLYAWFSRKTDETGILEKIRRSSTQAYRGDKLSAEAVEFMSAGILQGSITKLEDYASCPFKWYGDYLLGLKERKIFAVDNMGIGSLLHSAVEIYFRRMRDENFWYSQDADQRKATVAECIEEALNNGDDYDIFSDNARNTFLIKRLTYMVDRAVWALVEQGRSGSFVPEPPEMKFSPRDTEAMNIVIDNDNVMRLTGKIDRIDTYKDGENCYVKIIDYKSGNKELDISEIYHGVQIQLVLYLEAAMEIEQKQHPGMNIVPAGIYYFKMSDKWVDGNSVDLNDEVTVSNALLDEYKLDGMTNVDPAVIKELDNSYTGDQNSHILTFSNKAIKNGYSAAELSKITAHTNDVIGKMGSEMMSGEISAIPAYIKDHLSCKYCIYGQICGYSKYVPGYKYRKIDQITKEQFMES